MNTGSTAVSVSDVTVTLRATKRLSVPAWKGSFVRGAVGRGLMQCRDAKEARLVLFPSHQVGSGSDGGPMICYCPCPATIFSPNKSLVCSVRLFGVAASFDLQVADWIGLGLDRGSWRIAESSITKKICYLPAVGSLNGTKSPELRRVSFAFETPVRLKWRGQLAAVLTAPLVVRALVSRLGAVLRATGSTPHPPQKIDRSVVPWSHAADDNLGANDTAWYEYTRRRSNESVTMQFGGLVGSWSVRLSPQLFALSQALKPFHLGRQTTFGLGAFSVTDSLTSDDSLGDETGQIGRKL